MDLKKLENQINIIKNKLRVGKSDEVIRRSHASAASDWDFLRGGHEGKCPLSSMQNRPKKPRGRANSGFMIFGRICTLLKRRSRSSGPISMSSSNASIPETVTNTSGLGPRRETPKDAGGHSTTRNFLNVTR